MTIGHFNTIEEAILARKEYFKKMPNDTHKFTLYYLKNGELIKFKKHPEYWNNMEIQAHHYIKAQHYNKNPQWFIERKIKQKLIFLPRKLHEDLHSAMSDERFFELYNINRWDLLFSRKNYKEN
jgi:hypothetical protein